MTSDLARAALVDATSVRSYIDKVLSSQYTKRDFLELEAAVERAAVAASKAAAIAARYGSPGVEGATDVHG